MHFRIYDAFYSQNSHQIVSAGILVIISMARSNQYTAPSTHHLHAGLKLH